MKFHHITISSANGSPPEHDHPAALRAPAGGGCAGRRRGRAAGRLRRVDSTATSPETTNTPCSKPSADISPQSAPASSIRSAPTAASSDRRRPHAGDSPISTFPRTPGRIDDRAGRCSARTRGAMSRTASGSATHSCTPCSIGGLSGWEISLCTMPWPAVMMFSSPGRTIAWEPRLSRCSTSPSSSQLTVCRPVCGCAQTCMPAEPLDVLRSVMVKEAPGADHPDLPVRQGPCHLGRLAQIHPTGGQQQLLGPAVQPTRAQVFLWPQIKITHVRTSLRSSTTCQSLSRL